MLRSKHFFIFVLGCLLSACKAPETIFSAPGSIADPAFLRAIPPAIQRAEGGAAPFFRVVDVYRLRFWQAYAEAENVLVPAMLHDYGKTKELTYVAPLQGFRQDLYLLRLSSPQGNPYFVYFSVWYDYSADPPKQTGFGPAYWGKYDAGHKTIVFTHGLVVKESNEGLYLDPLKNSRKFFFVLDSLSQKQLNIQRIVLTEKNKIGADKMVVLPIRNTKLDPLRFTRVSTLQILQE